MVINLRPQKKLESQKISSVYISETQQGFTLPVVLILILIFVAAPVVFWLSNVKTNVKGVSTQTKEQGTYVQIVSELGAWDFFEYLCKSKDECVQSLTSGKKWEIISGGATSGSTLKLNYSDLWGDYRFLKLYVKQGWGSSVHPFTIKNLTNTAGAESVSVDGVNVLLVPVEYVKSDMYLWFSFTDKF